MIHHTLKLGPHRKVVIAILAIDEPMFFYQYHKFGGIRWTKDPNEAGGWTSVARAKNYVKDLCKGKHDDIMEEWARGQEYRAVKVESVRSYKLEVV